MVLSRTPSIFIINWMHEPLHVKNKEFMREERMRKPSVEVEVSKSAKIGSWSFIGCLLKLNYSQKVKEKYEALDLLDVAKITKIIE